MNLDIINSKKILLASNSPRRKILLENVGVNIEVITGDKVDESLPQEICPEESAKYLARKKNRAYKDIHADNTVLITADTVVILKGKILGKPKITNEAAEMLKQLSGNVHEVHTGVCLSTKDKEIAFSEISKVYFDKVSDNEIDYYIKNYKPFDKAGAYGIQEWIGHIGIVKIEGSYDNIVGLPVRSVYRKLIEICSM